MNQCKPKPREHRNTSSPRRQTLRGPKPLGSSVNGHEIRSGTNQKKPTNQDSGLMNKNQTTNQNPGIQTKSPEYKNPRIQEPRQQEPRNTTRTPEYNKTWNTNNPGIQTTPEYKQEPRNTKKNPRNTNKNPGIQTRTLECNKNPWNQNLTTSKLTTNQNPGLHYKKLRKPDSWIQTQARPNAWFDYKSMGHEVLDIFWSSPDS